MRSLRAHDENSADEECLGQWVHIPQIVIGATFDSLGRTGPQALAMPFFPAS
jgi:hypothetical protein